MKRISKKKKLLLALKKAGLPYSMPNFVHKYERKICTDRLCPKLGQPFLVSPRDNKDNRVYTSTQIKEIITSAKRGWFKKHWHWPI